MRTVLTLKEIKATDLGETMGGGSWQRRWLHVTLGLLISAGCLAWAAHELFQEQEALSRLTEAFSSADYRYVIPFWICLVLFYVIKAWRWRYLLQPVGDFHTYRELLPPTLIGFAFNNLLPAHLGDFVRVFLFARQRQIPVATVLSTVVLERVFDILAILVWMGWGLIFVPEVDPQVHRGMIIFAGIAGSIVIGAGIFITWTGPCVALLNRSLNMLRGVSHRWQDKLCELLTLAATGLQSLKNPRMLGSILVGSFAQWLLNAAMVHLALWAFGLRVSLTVSAIVMGVVALGVVVPSSPGYFGVIQICFLTVLKLFGYNPADIFAASVFYHLAQYIPVTVTGLLFFNMTGLSISEVEARAEAARESAERPTCPV